MISILALETGKSIKNQINKAIEEIEYRRTFVDSPDLAREELEHQHYDLILADMGDGGCELCDWLRRDGNTIPVIILLEAPTPKDKRMVFRAKADGYLEIPFDREELQMRMKNLLWRCHIEDEAEVRYGDCVLCTKTYTVQCGSVEIELRRMEFLLLEKLLSYPGRIFSRGQLMDELWGYDCESNPRTVDAHVRQLRRKLRPISSIRIQTMRGIGYRAAVPK